MEHEYNPAAGQSLGAYDIPKLATRETIRMQITRQIAEFEKLLEKKRAMLELLDKNPAIEQFMDLSNY